VTGNCEHDNDFSGFVETGTSRLAERISASQEILSPWSWFVVFDYRFFCCNVRWHVDILYLFHKRN
jgi:hypothetical protein